MRGVRWLAVEICIKGLREGGGRLVLVFRWRVIHARFVPCRENANEYRERAILSRNWFHAERDDFHCIVRSIPLYLVRDRIAEMALVSPFPCTNFTHAYFIRIVSSIEPHSRTTYHSRGAMISSHFVALVVPRKRGSLGGIHDGV